MSMMRGVGEMGEARPHDRALPRPGDLLPPLALPATDGVSVRLSDYKQKRPLLVVCLHARGCAACGHWLSALAAEAATLAELEVVVLAAIPESLAALRAWRADLVLPFALATDAAGVAAAALLPASGGVALYVADRYRAVVERWLTPEATGLPAPADALAYLRTAEQDDCGCGLPAWPREEVIR